MAETSTDDGTRVVTSDRGHALDERCINAIRFLAIDMVEEANAGHPGAPMGMAPMAYVLFTRHLRHHPSNPHWPDRDRFILSAGHASALQYALLHLTGYDLPIDELRRFRQWGSRTPGHPERGLTPGVEVTTGPLGQGFANGVGMAIAESWLAARFNDASHRVIDHHVYAICSDGDIQEGITSEAASLAGHLRLGKLVYLYDDNDIQIDGPTDRAFSEDVGTRFEAYGWHVAGPIDGTDLAAIDAAISEAKADARPSLVIVKTRIAHGSPNKEGTADAHGAPLGADEVVRTRKALGWPHAPFVVPDDVLEHMRHATIRGEELVNDWARRADMLARTDPERGEELRRMLADELPEGWESALTSLFVDVAGRKEIPTRKASGAVLNALADRVPNLLGGSADLGGSNNTFITSDGDYAASNRTARNLAFGVREHAMCAIASGMSIHGGVVPYTGTFLTFSDYMRPAIRLAALQEARVVYVFTHDSIGLGEDGPTHQPIEHLAALRAIPNLVVIRPSDPTEVPEAWRVALERTAGPTAIVLTRQGVPYVDRSRLAPAEGLRKGAYVLRPGGTEPAMILLATGSEVALALGAADLLAADGIHARVVAMPSWELFRTQPPGYRDEVLPPSIPARLAVEAGASLGWHEWIGDRGEVLGIDAFGASAKSSDAFRGFGFTVENVVACARAVLRR